MEVQLATQTPTRLGRYEVLCELGHGGMAVLYLARAAGIGGFERLFALKMIHPHLGKEEGFVRMFLEEARLAARIRHPNVVPVYEVDVELGRHYIAMDYLSGETFGAVLSQTWPKGRSFPIGLATYVVAMAAEGLHAAHELRGPDQQLLGVVHRDVTPQNLMLGYDGSVRVMDFGVAKALDQVSHSRPGTFKGTPAYMSPEHVLGEPLDRRADTFSLGVLLWEATLGKRLFKSTTELKTAARVLKMEVPNPRSIAPDYPAPLADIVMRALQRPRDERYATARALAEDLQHFMSTSGLRGSPGELEAFMRNIFSERLEERLELERKALLPRPIGLALRRVDDSIIAPSVQDSVSDARLEGAFDEVLSPGLQVQQPVVTRPPWADTGSHSRVIVRPNTEPPPAAPAPSGRKKIALGIGAAVVVLVAALAYAFRPADEGVPEHRGPSAVASAVPTSPAPQSAAPSPAAESPAASPAASASPAAAASPAASASPAPPSPAPPSPSPSLRAAPSPNPVAAPSPSPRVKRQPDRRVPKKKKKDDLFDGSDL
ncbi:MAG: serine/threonine-protein kinase [Myxococcota bacterium]